MYETTPKINEPADIIICLQGQGMVLKEKSLLAYDKTTQKILAIGTEAERLIENPQENIAVCSPLRQGAVADYIAASRLFAGLLRNALGKKPLIKPPVALCVPPNLSEVEKRAIEEALHEAGAKEILITDIPADQYIRETPENHPKQYKKYKILISITKDDPEPYIKELLTAALTYAEQTGITKEKVQDLLTSLN